MVQWSELPERLWIGDGPLPGFWIRDWTPDAATAHRFCYRPAEADAFAPWLAPTRPDAGDRVRRVSLSLALCAGEGAQRLVFEYRLDEGEGVELGHTPLCQVLPAWRDAARKRLAEPDGPHERARLLRAFARAARLSATCYQRGA